MSLTEDVEAGIKYINSVADQSTQLLTNINGLMMEYREHVADMKDVVKEMKKMATESMESKEEVLVDLKLDIRKDVGRFYTRVITFAIPLATVFAFFVAFV